MEQMRRVILLKGGGDLVIDNGVLEGWVAGDETNERITVFQNT